MNNEVKHERMVGDVPVRYWRARMAATLLQLLVVAALVVLIILGLWVVLSGQLFTQSYSGGTYGAAQMMVSAVVAL